MPPILEVILATIAFYMWTIEWVFFDPPKKVLTTHRDFELWEREA